MPIMSPFAISRRNIPTQVSKCGIARLWLQNRPGHKRIEMGAIRRLPTCNRAKLERAATLCIGPSLPIGNVRLDG